MGRQGDRQGDLMVMWSEMPRSPGHVFYDRLQEVLVGAGFDGFVEDTCRAFYAKTMGAPSVEFRQNRNRTGTRLSSGEWGSATDPDARIARMKEGTPQLAYKTQHAVDLGTGAIVAAEIHAADESDTTTLSGTLAVAEAN